ncbi:L-pipecolate oxidase [Colletotrichum fructicola]|nr:L-pipecolate oxidase [Colletotrichum fructicola]
MELRFQTLCIWFLCGVALAQNATEPPAPLPVNGSLPTNGSSTTNGTSPVFAPCALDCISREVVLSPCQTIDNTTCVCNDQGFYKQVEKCIMAGCTPREGIATQKAKAEYCHDPVRSQVKMLYGLRSLEIAAWFLVLFRFYARWATRLRYGWDDYIIYIPELVISQLMDDNAFGRDTWNLEWDKIMLEPLYLLQLGLTKISILFLYLRIFPGRRFKRITYAFIIFVAGTTAALVGGSIVECWPIGYFWEAWNTEYLIHTTKCLNLTAAVCDTVPASTVLQVPDGSSCDISRVIRFDYADEDYLNVSYEAYLKWSKDPKFKDIFHPSPYILTGSMTGGDEFWIDRTTRQLSNKGLAWTKLDDAAAAKRAFPTLSGKLAEPGFKGYYNDAAGWADATKAIIQLRDECLELGVSFISGPAGTVVGLDTDSENKIRSVQTLGGISIPGDHFVLAAGAWSSNLVPMYNSVLATAQVIAYTPLSDTEVQRYEKLPIYANFNTGWFNFPAHADTKSLKMAVHGWGYTRTPSKGEALIDANISTHRVYLSRERPNFCPSEGEERLRNGLREILPELADRPFEKVTMCWYTDTPSGDFIMDYHPDYQNLFVGGAGSGQ